MEQRPLRLGDLVDDYCPRERRVTNHAIVAIVNNSIRQTRCATCETEHVYRGAQPPRRRPRAGSAEPVADNGGGQLVAPVQAEEPGDPGEPAQNGSSAQSWRRRQASVDEAAPAEAAEREADTGEGAPAGEGPAPESSQSEEEEEEDDRNLWPANRQLIRATLPRTEGDVPPPRPIPEFTIYQRQNGRGRGFQQGRGWNERGHGGNGARGGERRSGPGFGGPGPSRRRHGKRRPR